MWSCLRNCLLVGALIASGATLAGEPEVSVQGKAAMLVFRLEVQAPSDRVLNALFDVNNLSLLSRADKVELLSQGPSRQVVKYTYRTWFMENQSIYERTRVPEEGKILMLLKGNTRSSTLLPQQDSASGYYKVWSRPGGSVVEYRQETQFSRDLGFLERRYLEGNGKDQIARMKAFILGLK